MRLVTLHDNLNPTQEVKVDADSVSTVEPFGSGSLLKVGESIVAVRETRSEVEAAVWPTS